VPVDLNLQNAPEAYSYLPTLVLGRHHPEVANHTIQQLGIVRNVENERHNTLPRNPSAPDSIPTTNQRELLSLQLFEFHVCQVAYSICAQTLV
jgi:hypothetical protein